MTELRFRLENMWRKRWLTIAWLMPKALVYWCVIRAGAKASTGQWGHEFPTEMKFFTVLERWGTQDEIKKW